MDIQKLDSKVYQWAEFLDAYKSCINENKSLTAVEKFTYLCSYLTNSTRACAADFALTEVNYEAEVRLLMDCFGKDIIIKRALANKLINVKQVFNENEVNRLRGL